MVCLVYSLDVYLWPRWGRVLRHRNSRDRNRDKVPAQCTPMNLLWKKQDTSTCRAVHDTIRTISLSVTSKVPLKWWTLIYLAPFVEAKRVLGCSIHAICLGAKVYVLTVKHFGRKYDSDWVCTHLYDPVVGKRIADTVH